MNAYSIHFKGLKVGKHTFNFEVDDKFFDEFEEGEIKKGNLQVEVLLNKQSLLLDLTISFEGSVEVVCDRCLENLELPISYKGSLYVKFGEDKSEEGDDIIILPIDETE